MSRWLAFASLWVALYLSGWYATGTLFQVVQLVGALLVCAAGAFALMSGRVKRITPRPIELILCTTFVFSSVVAMFRGDMLSAAYGLLFLTIFLAIAHLSRMLVLDQLLRTFRVAYLCLLATILLTQLPAFLISLVGTYERGIGLVRFQPLGLHPNLSGFVYGGGALLFTEYAVVSGQRRLTQVFMVGAALLCICMMLAASARASMLALAVASLPAAAFLVAKATVRQRVLLFGVTLLGVGVLVWHLGSVMEYLSRILDLESDTRGFDSGATGRTVLWSDGIHLAFSDPILLLTGRGTRSASPDNIGFSVESSYINLLIEYGVLISTIILGRMIFIVWRLFTKPAITGLNSTKALFIGMMLVFAMVQSVFNRYLIAVGNIFSLLLLFLLAGVEVRIAVMRKSRNSSGNSPRNLVSGQALNQ